NRELEPTRRRNSRRQRGSASAAGRARSGAGTSSIVTSRARLTRQQREQLRTLLDPLRPRLSQVPCRIAPSASLRYRLRVVVQRDAVELALVAAVAHVVEPVVVEEPEVMRGAERCRPRLPLGHRDDPHVLAGGHVRRVGPRALVAHVLGKRLDHDVDARHGRADLLRAVDVAQPAVLTRVAVVRLTITKRLERRVLAGPGVGLQQLEAKRASVERAEQLCELRRRGLDQPISHKSPFARYASMARTTMSGVNSSPTSPGRYDGNALFGTCCPL